MSLTSVTVIVVDAEHPDVTDGDSASFRGGLSGQWQWNLLGRTGCRLPYHFSASKLIFLPFCIELICIIMHVTIMNKSSAVAEMGDRGHNKHAPKRGGLLCPFCR